MKKEIYLIGVGNYTEVIIELARDCGYLVKGLYHYNSERNGEFVLGVEILGSTEDLFKNGLKELSFGITIGNNSKRQEIANKIRSLNGVTPNLIHPTAKISESAIIETGCFFQANAMVWAKALVNSDCILSPNSYISHHAKVDSSCFLAPFSVVGAYCSIGKRVTFGINSIIIPKLSLGDDSIVGAKANILQPFDKNSILIGNPAIILEKK
ncbi:MAG: acetyltransferase [Flavobacteriaceae bacterium]|nr:acetyltransferase [Flavobacteriaceae bacterium]